jgi:hypothetical protein
MQAIAVMAEKQPKKHMLAGEMIREGRGKGGGGTSTFAGKRSTVSMLSALLQGMDVQLRSDDSPNRNSKSILTSQLLFCRNPMHEDHIRV